MAPVVHQVSVWPKPLSRTCCLYNIIQGRARTSQVEAEEVNAWRWRRPHRPRTQLDKEDKGPQHRWGVAKQMGYPDEVGVKGSISWIRLKGKKKKGKCQYIEQQVYCPVQSIIGHTKQNHPAYVLVNHWTNNYWLIPTSMNGFTSCFQD